MQRDDCDRYAAGENLTSALDHAPPMPEPAPVRDPSTESEPDREKSRPLEIIWQIAKSATLRRGTDGTAHAIVDASTPGAGRGHREAWPVESRGFRRWLTRAYLAVANATPPPDSLTRVIQTIEASATESTEVYRRVAPDGDGGVWLDLGDAEWRAVHVTPAGWSVERDCSVLFRRAATALPLPVPEQGGSLHDLRGVLPPLASDDAWTLLVAWLVGALSPTGPYAIATLTGPPGAGKSTAARMLRMLVDPATPELRREPREDRDVAAAARNCHVLAWDNLSGIRPWLADALCCLSTGTGWAARTLFTDADETVITGAHPIILSSIEVPTARSDVLDRAAVAVALARIDAHIPESDVWARYNDARPRVMGALLDRLSGALRELPTVRRDPPRHRLADFAALAVAAERGAGDPPRILAALADVREAGVVEAIDGAAIGPPMQRFIERRRADGARGELWTGTSAELLAALTAELPDPTNAPRRWPKSPRAMSGALDRLSPALREVLRVKVDRSQRAAGTGRRLLRLLDPDG